MKKRILWIGESSVLNTGFAQYYNFLLRKIHNSGKFDIAEFGSYLSGNDPRAETIPWKFYGNEPDIVSGPEGQFLNPTQQQEFHGPDGQDYRLNQFGKWRFEKVLADFKPDIVVDIRDNWMMNWELKSPFRKYFKLVWMPTVDGHPQDPSWLDEYTKVDGILTYSNYGKKVLEEESGGSIKVSGVTSPGVDTDIFRPSPKNLVREKLGLKGDFFIIGTVMRNQPRKLFSELILTYKKLLDRLTNLNKKNIKRPYLLLHTGIPDVVGWNIPLEVKRNNLVDSVLFTYICRDCQGIFIHNWLGETTKCAHCGADNAITPNTSIGLDSKQLALIYNVMDVYIQASVCEGWGLPISEAKACEIPVLGVDWTAISEQVNAPGALPIKVASIFTDNGTMQRRALFDQDDLAKKLYRLLYETPDKLIKMGKEGRRSVIGSWDYTASIWMDYLTSLTILDRKDTWDKPPQIIDLENIIVPELDFDESVKWMYKNLIGVDAKEEDILKLKEAKAPLKQIEKNIRARASVRNDIERLRCWGKFHSENVVDSLDANDKFRILYVMPKSAGDVLLSTAVVAAIKKKYPHASVYFATEPKYQSILKNNPHIKGILKFEESLLDYRLTEGCADDKGYFDITYNPYIVTQKIPHSWHNGYGDHLLKIYANMCGVEATCNDVWIDKEEFKLDVDEFVTVHTGSSFDIKNYDHMQAVVHYIKLPVVHVGNIKDPPLENVIDLRGKTTPQQMAYVISKSKLHIGVDSFPAHVAAAVGTDVITLFGSTFSNNCKPKPKYYGSHIFGMQEESKSIVVEPKNRWECIKPCHYEKCTQAEKCINNIEPMDIVKYIVKSIDSDLVKSPIIPRISSYCITLNAIESGLPFKESINNHLKFSEEVVVVDGGSTDGTFEQLMDLASFNKKIKIATNTWDYNKPDMMGVQKTLARKLCKGNYLWQFDIDEFVPEWQHNAIYDLIINYPHVILFDIPCVTFSGGMTTVGRTENFFKWRLSKNVPGIIHGVNREAIQLDKDGNMFFNREQSDSCEYIWERTREIVKRFPPTDKRLFNINLEFMDKEIPDYLLGEYKKLISELVNGDKIPCVFHYSWIDYERKARMSKFWAKQKKYYSQEGLGTREGKWLDKKEISEQDIKELTEKFYNRKTFPIDIKHHPDSIMRWAIDNNWNQVELFKNKLVVV